MVWDWLGWLWEGLDMQSSINAKAAQQSHSALYGSLSAEISPFAQ